MKHLLRIFVLVFALPGGWSTLRAQVDFTEELWTGLILNARVSDHWSLWQDMHFVPGNFYVTRSGVTYHHRDRWVITGGYATVLTNTSFTHKLVRNEHRPWGQAELRIPLASGKQLRTRFRYDARFRQQIEGGEVLREYGFYHRLRFMAALRIPLGKPGVALTVMNETLLNAGPDRPWNILDQSRLFNLIEFPLGPLRMMTGYHVRPIPQQAGGYRVRHGLTVWLLYGIDGRGPAAECAEC